MTDLHRGVIISNGHFKFILAPLAAEVARRGMLALFLTGAYPSPLMLHWFRGRRFGPGGFRRFIAREEPGIPPELVRPKRWSEVLVQSGMAVKRVTRRTDWGQQWEMVGMRQYAASARRDVRKADALIYHYRCGYGHRSVAEARRRGMITICDHSLPNPEIMDHLIEHEGAWPESGAGARRRPWSDFMLPDLRAADYLVVNSDFVKESFVRYGWDGTRIFVHYTGIDNDFGAALPKDLRRDQPKPRLVFAGEISRRKGIDTIAAALRGWDAPDFEFDLIGPRHEDAASALASLRTDSRVKLIDFLPRRELASHLARADIFVFPSLAEGSARVVFMALAAGCYVITTPNSGSIVRDGQEGRIVPAGDSVALRQAMAEALARRAEIARIGTANAELVRNHYTQSQYGDGIVRLYGDLLRARASGNPRSEPRSWLRA